MTFSRPAPDGRPRRPEKTPYSRHAPMLPALAAALVAAGCASAPPSDATSSSGRPAGPAAREVRPHHPTAGDLGGSWWSRLRRSVVGSDRDRPVQPDGARAQPGREPPVRRLHASTRVLEMDLVERQDPPRRQRSGPPVEGPARARDRRARQPLRRGLGRSRRVGLRTRRRVPPRGGPRQAEPARRLAIDSRASSCTSPRAAGNDDNVTRSRCSRSTAATCARSDRATRARRVQFPDVPGGVAGRDALRRRHAQLPDPAVRSRGNARRRLRLAEHPSAASTRRRGSRSTRPASCTSRTAPTRASRCSTRSSSS